MPFLPSYRVREIIQAAKCLQTGHALTLTETGDRGRTFEVALDLLDGPFTPMRFLGGTYDLRDPAGFHAAFVLEGQRVRGVDFCPVAKRHFYKVIIPTGWHQNVLDPNLPTRDPNFNRHLALSDFAPADFQSFIGLVAEMWNIDLGEEAQLL